MSHIEASAAALRKAAEVIYESATVTGAAEVDARLRVAEGFARLAAIEQGIPACAWCCGQREPGPAGSGERSQG